MLLKLNFFFGNKLDALTIIASQWSHTKETEHWSWSGADMATDLREFSKARLSVLCMQKKLIT